MRIALVVVLFVAVSQSVLANDADLEFFEKKIRPLLVTHCYECHSSDSKKLGGELLLDSREGVRKGGESGSAIQLGQPDGSLLIKAVRYTDDSVKMPPKGKLPDSAIADLEEWVRKGAVDPREQSTRTQPVQSWPQIMIERSNWWSLKPVRQPTVPSVENVGTQNDSDVDRFIVASLASSGLLPASATDPRTFARRSSLVLTGLMPTSEQIDRFEAECKSAPTTDSLPKAAVEKYVDSLLDSPHFGEQWARHWMDIVRFSETHGNEWNYEVHHAWRYRDYLIRAFNADVPYNQFVSEHIAGDLLPNPRWNPNEQINESVIGTGFYRFGEVNHDDCITLRSLGYDLLDNQIDTMTKAFLATTVACARCHNHKLDAISSEDYYALLGVLRSSRNVSHCIDSPDANAKQKQRMREIKSELRQELASIWRSDAARFATFMQAAHAVRAKRQDASDRSVGLDPKRLEKWIATLSAEKQPLEEPFEIWRQLSAAETPATPAVPADANSNSRSTSVVWKELATRFASEERERADFNQTRFMSFGDFRNRPSNNPQEGRNVDWTSGGQAFAGENSNKAEFVIHPETDNIVQTFLPTGRYTHILSSKLNGTLRSPVLPAGKKYISFQVLGQRSSAVRLVSNSCQLNYANYRAMTFPDFQWVTFSPPEDRESLRTYAELMTMFDNPKFPDQLAPLGGDNTNYKFPWEKAAENPRSYFGVIQVVLHDSPETPKPELSHLHGLLDSRENASSGSPDELHLTLDKLIAQYAGRMEAAIEAWAADKATDDDVRWLDSLIRRELISNDLHQSPRCESLVREYRQVDSELSLPRVCCGVSDGGPGINQPVFIRGDCNRPAETVPRRFVEVLSTTLKPFASPNSGRLELAERIASAENPLTARVMVNRVWHHLFGTGLVKTVDDFGHVGEKPSHPELLDHLTVDFVKNSWSMKHLIRSLVLTKAFQRSNHASEQSREIDPQNRLLQHYPARRMDAELVRDAILTSSGRLDAHLFGMSVQPYRETEYADRRLFPGPLDGNGRRSIYIKNNLMESPKFLGAFNFPGGKVTQGRRDVTNVPAQALALLNDPFVLQQADVWSQNVLKNSRDSVATRLDSMFRSAIGRSPTAEELGRFEQAVHQLADLYQVSADGIMSSQAVWKDVAHSIFNLSEFLYIP